jgi:hypothetical protein
MNKTYFILITIFTFFTLKTDLIYSQIGTTKIPEISSNNNVNVVEYDSTYNFPGNNPESLIGQKLYLLPNIVLGRFVNHPFFRKEPTSKVNYRRPSSSYYLYVEDNSPYGRSGSDYTKLNEKYFEVKDVVRNDEGIFLKLYNGERNEEFYYMYPQDYVLNLYINDDKQFEWGFIVLGFYEKMKQKLVGTSVVLKNSKYTWLNSDIKRVPLRDLNTGEEVSYSIGMEWVVDDLTINESNEYSLSMILSEPSGQRIMVSLDYIGKLGLGPKFGIYTKNEYEELYKKYGDKMLLVLDSIVQIGFNYELVELAISDYSVLDVNTTVTNGIRFEQWVLGGDRYIYFDDGVVTSFQF